MPKITKNNSQNNAVVYARFSCDKQRDESIEDQLRVCSEYAQRHGYKIIGQYCDFAISGRTDQRPQFQKMIKDAAKEKFQIVLVYKTDRFARNRWDSAIYKKQLFEHGIKVISATEAIPSGGGGIIMESIYESWAELYSIQISQNVKRAAKGNALKSKSNGGYTPFGYQVNPITRQYELNPDTAPIATEVFSRAAAGVPFESILHYINNTGHKFTKAMLYYMLNNERYTGVYIYGDTRIEGGMPVITTKETFALVQRRKSAKKLTQRDKSYKYMFSHKCTCGKCGGSITGEYCVNHCGKRYQYYTCCNHKKHHTCNAKRVRADIAEEAVLKVMCEFITRPNLLPTFISSALKYRDNLQLHNGEINLLKNKLADIQKRKKNLLTAIEEGAMSSSTFSRLSELEQEENDLQIKLTEKSKKYNFTNILQLQLEYFAQQIKDNVISAKKLAKNIFEVLISQIFLFHDHIILVYDLRNDVHEKIKLHDIENAEYIENLATSQSDNKKSSEHISVRSCKTWLPE